MAGGQAGRNVLGERPLDQAIGVFLSALDDIGFFAADEEELAVQDALGRVTSRPVHATRDVPHFRAAAMDGIAVRAEETIGASEDRPRVLRENVDFVYVDTGEPVPAGFDAVIMIERVRELGGGEVEVREPASPGQHVRQVGEDLKKGEMIVPAGHEIRPETIAALLNAGNLRVHVKRRLRALFIPTGAELVPPDAPLAPGLVPETNSQIFRGYLELWGAEAEVHPIVKDSEQLEEAVSRALRDFKLIAIGAGTSKGREDFTYRVVNKLGRVLVHGVACRPGHPVLLGIIDGRAVLGLPGYPVSVWLSTILFIRPLLLRYLGRPQERPLTVKGRLTRAISSTINYREFIRVDLERAPEGLLVHPLPGKSSRLSSVINAKGIIVVPEGVSGLPAGAEVEVQLLQGPVFLGGA